MSTIDVRMTSEELAEYEEMKKVKAEKVLKEKMQGDVETYKLMVDEIVEGLFPTLLIVSNSLGGAKRKVYEDLLNAIEIKKDLFNVKENQNSHTFMNKEGTKRISIGYNVMDSYDDTVNEGVEKVKEYIRSLAHNEETEQLVEVVEQLLSKDKKGNIKPSKVVMLSNLADKYNNEMFKEGVKIIKEAYKPTYSKQYVRAEFKDAKGVWINIPLGMTEA